MPVAVRPFERRDRDQLTSLVNLHVGAVIPGLVLAVGAECAFPALGCYGVPDTLPHIHRLLREAGFGEPTRTELVLVALCEALTGRHRPELERTRRLGLLGTRFTLERDGQEVGFVEVADHSAEMARSSVAARWADVGNLIVADESQLSWAMPQLLSVAAEWLLLGGVTRLVDYWARDVAPASYLDQLQELGFRTLVVNQRGLRRTL